ncbi:MAG TPA: SUMF1/EgtB/PvdO family nonheme iron enzyme [Balneolaceae bacterium]|nr:SUMF1/EgtB/PvdO family nonheme iron enzyme [Balneolaceae bacterium]
MKRKAVLTVLFIFSLISISNAQSQPQSWYKASYWIDHWPDGQQFPVPGGCMQMEGQWKLAWTPCTPEVVNNFLREITFWSNEWKIRKGYDGSRYDDPALKWTQSSFIQPQMMAEDRYFYDPETHQYTVDRYLDDLEKRYGGIDAVLIWPEYTNLGVDARNQLDMIRSMPGGIDGVKQMIKDFHQRGVRVLFPMMMWDQGTHKVENWPKAIAQMMAEIGADGVNGDTQEGVPLAFVKAAEDIGHPLAFEPEGGPPAEELGYNLLTWGQYDYPFAPLVDKYRWIERRHMVNVCDRWAKDKTDNLQFAFFNGEGYESWENVWGIWNGITPRDGEAIRRMATIERAVAPFFISQDWRPYFPMLRYGVFASKWPLHDQTVWTIVNRNPYNINGQQMKLPYKKGMHYYDLYHGVELTPQRDGDQVILSFEMEEKGFGALLASETPPDNTISSLMSKMKNMTQKPLSDYSHEWKALSQEMTPIPSTKVTTKKPEGMVKIPGGEYTFNVRGIENEGENNPGVDVQYPWENSARRFHHHKMHINSFWMDKYPVTNQEFQKFLEATHYHPEDDLNFLKDWNNGTYPKGWGNKPVTWISLEDARAYAKWAGKRLPHEWEWQYAAQGTTGNQYPWGNTWDSTAVPVPDKGHTLTGPDDVDAHPKGASPFGVTDMVGNVWQWTDEFMDEHTRAAIVRGGSYYKPLGSAWYFPQAYKNDEHGHYLLMAPSYDRSGTIGFRCVKDAEK